MTTKKSNQTNQSNKPNHFKDLGLLFAIPIGVAIFAAIAVYTPRLLANPQHDFIYSVCYSYSCNNDLRVDGSGYITRQPGFNSNRYDEGSSLHYYSAKDDSTKSLTLEEARQYRLDRSSKAPDGYSLTREEGSDGFLFWSSSSSGWYLKDGFKKKPVELTNNSSYYSRSINFLGWINR